MGLKNLRRFEHLQMAALLSGSVLAWLTTIKEFVRFYQIEGTIFKIKDCAIPNPITTPCFWGATAFLVALIWAVYIYKQKKGRGHQRKLMLFLAASTVFGWANVAYDYYKYFGAKMEPIQTCSGLVKSPLYTACFWGSVLYLLALLLTIKIVRQKKARG